MGVAYVDSTNYTIGYGEFLDNDQFTNLESFLVQVGTKECLFEKRKDTELEQKKLLKLLQLCEVAACDVKGTRLHVQLLGSSVFSRLPVWNGKPRAGPSQHSAGRRTDKDRCVH